MKYEILDKHRRNILPLFKAFKKDFYLAGGTGLALQLGHRDSHDFDFFSPRALDTKKLYNQVKQVFKDYKIKKIQDETNTLTVLLDDKIKISFFAYPYKLINKTINDNYLRVASLVDIACMKLSAITSRATNKDYLDLYFILKEYQLASLLKFAEKKFKDLDAGLILKSLVYFDDVTKEPIRFRTASVDWPMVKSFLEKEVRRLK